MEMIRGEPAGPPYIPRLSLEDASQLFTKLYNHEVHKVKKLAGYVTQNFYIQTLSSGDAQSAKEYVLKLCTFQYHNMKELVQVTLKTMLYLNGCGMVCPVPLKTITGDYITQEELKCEVLSSSKKKEDCTTKEACLIYTLTYISGKTLGDACHKSIPLPWYQVLGKHLARMDRALMEYPYKEDIPMMTKFGENLEWSLNAIPRYRALLHVVKDNETRHLIESVIDEFAQEVVPKMSQLRKAMIYNDFNHNNIITAETNGRDEDNLEIIGIIDFNDMCYTCLLFEISIAMTYMMFIQKDGNLYAAGQQFLQGYESTISLAENEWQLLPVCVAARCVQTILAGLYSYEQDPTNEYVLSDVEVAHTVLKFVRSVPALEIVKHWRGQASN